MDRAFEFRSRLRANAETVWAHARTFRGVNAELWPLCRMTCPPAYTTRTIEDMPRGQRAFRSWILLFGAVPIDYDDIAMARVTPPHGFFEESTMLTQRRWAHERVIETVDGGCVVKDHVTFEPRIAFLAPVFHTGFRLAFWNRHRRLKKLFDM